MRQKVLAPTEILITHALSEYRHFLYKRYLFCALVSQQPFSISRQILHIRISAACTISNFNQTVVTEILRQWTVVCMPCGPAASMSNQFTMKSHACDAIHRQIKQNQAWHNVDDGLRHGWRLTTNTLSLRQNASQFADDIFKWIFPHIFDPSQLNRIYCMDWSGGLFNALARELFWCLFL